MGPKMIPPYGTQIHKIQSDFSTDDSMRKVIYMSANKIDKKWTQPVRS
jgi:transposase-like protein